MSNPLPLPFPYLPGEQKPDSYEERSQQNFDALALALGGLFGTGGLPNIRFGTDSMTGDGTPTKIATVNHGLGTTPIAVFVGSRSSDLNGAASTFGATSFTAILRHVDNTNWNSAQTFYWLAIA